MEYNLKCGCSVWISEYDGKATIHYCPQHKAAPDLYEACKQALRTFEARGISPTDDRRRLLEKALAKAEMK